MRVDSLNRRAGVAVVSIAYSDRTVKQYSVVAEGVALYVRRDCEAPLDIKLQRIKKGGRGDLIADFEFFCDGVYEWRKVD